MALTLEKALNILINSVALYSSVWEYLSQIIVTISIVYWRYMIDDFSLVTRDSEKALLLTLVILQEYAYVISKIQKFPARHCLGLCDTKVFCVHISGSWPKREIVLKGHLWERKRCLPAPGFSRPLTATNILTLMLLLSCTLFL